jgi:undecaprenyl-diphosphatase
VEHSYWHAVWIGIVEGLTEFLPVSSTAHIRITQELLGQDSEDPYGKMFAIVIQLGAILAVLVYFRKRLADFVRSFVQPRDPPADGNIRWPWCCSVLLSRRSHAL